MTTKDFKRKLSAIFSADVAGYSRLMGEDEAATVEAITTYREIMGGLIRQHRGRVVDSPGDNLLAEFASVVDAVQCAVAVQKEFQARNAESPENRRMELRIGINLGDVIEEEDRIYGDGVNIAARLEALADPGGICVSKTAFDQIETKLPLGYEYLGDQDVKNIAKPVGAYRVLMEPRITTVAGAKAPKIPLWRHKAVLAGGLVALVTIIGLTFWNLYLRAPREKPISVEKMAFPLPEKPSIAVLPFDNLSANPEYASLADAVSDSIIYTLTYLPSMFVIARNSTFAYKGKPVEIRQVAEELGVRYVLEGSVMRDGDRVRVTAQLIDATSGYHIWSGRFDRTINDIFSLLDELTKTIAIELQVKVSPDQWAGVTHKTDNFDAWAAATRAYILFTRGGRENVVEARSLAEKAVALDPKYGFGWTVLAVIHTLEVLYGFSQSPAESIKLAYECNEKALTLDPTLSCATANRGQIYLLQGKIKEAIALGKKAIAMGPSLDTNYLILGIIMEVAGRFEEAIALYKKAMRLNPFYPAGYLRRYGMSCLMADHKEEALTAFKELLGRAKRGEYPPLFPHLALCAVYAELGKEAEAKAEVTELLNIDRNFSLESARKAYHWKNPQHMERWLSSLRKAGLPETPPLPLPNKPSIAVLPFVNMSGDPEQEYFSDGITEEIITALSKTTKLFVIARNSSFTYKGKPVWIPTVGRELGVRYVLEGSVRKSGDKVRITAQLIDAKTNQHLWAERYDRELKDIFAIQDAITMKIITALQVKLTEGDQIRMWSKQFNNLDVYLKYMEARSLWAKGTKESHVRFGQVAQEIIDMAPESGIGYKLMGWRYWWLAMAGKSPRENIGKAFKLAQKALSIDKSDSATHAILGSIYMVMRKYEKAIAEGERSVELDPNGAMVNVLLGYTLRSAGRPDEAIVHLKQGIRLNPFPPYFYFNDLGSCYMQMGKYEEALEEYKKAYRLAPGNLHTQLGLTVIYSLLNREEEARSAASKVLEISPQFSVASSKSWPYKNKADLKLIVDALRKAGLK